MMIRAWKIQGWGMETLQWLKGGFLLSCMLLASTSRRGNAESTQWPSSFQPDTDVCDPSQYNEDNFPLKEAVPPFNARVECNFGKASRTMDAHELFGAHRGDVRMYERLEVAAVLDERLRTKAVESRSIYNFHHQELDTIVEIGRKDRECRTITMGSEDSGIAGIFGFNATDPNKAHIFTVAGSLYMGTQYRFKPAVTSDVSVRGIPAVAYETCVPYERKKATLKVTYYFTSPDWEPSDEGHGIHVPLRIHVLGKGEFGKPSKGSTTGEITGIDTYYDIVDYFQYEPWETDFSPPPTVICPGRKYHGPASYQWEPTDHFHMDAEIFYFDVQDREMKLYERKEYFDKHNKYTRFDFIVEIGETNREFHFMEHIRDFNTGHTYTTDVTMGICSIDKLVPNGFDVILDEHGHLQMVTPAELLQDYKDYSYQGKHFERDIETYVHTANRSFGDLDLTISVWTTARNVEDEGETEVGKPVPIRFWMGPTDEGQHENFHPITYNVFKYDDMVPTFHAWNIRRCFNDSAMQWLRFILDGADSSWNLEEYSAWFLYEAHQVIATRAQVVPIRIHNVWYDINGLPGRIMIGFGLFERPEQAGAENMDNYPHATLKEAWANLEREINQGTFNLTVPVITGTTGPNPGKPEFKSLLAIPGSLKSASDLVSGFLSDNDGDSGYSSGDMAAMGICMLLIGIGGVVGFVFWMHRRK